MDHGIPEGFIGLGDAYEQAFQYLEDKELASALIKQWSPVEFTRDGVTKTIAYGTDPKAQAAYDGARDRVEEIMRMALCRGVLVPFFRDSQSGEPLQPLERDGWERSSEIPGFGLQNTIDDTFCPGPAELVGRPVFLRTEQFQEWLTKSKPSGSDPACALERRRGAPQKYDWQMVETEVARLMDYHGDFAIIDPDWKGALQLREKIEEFCLKIFGSRPSDSTLKEKLPPMVEKWRSQKEAADKADK